MKKVITIILVLCLSCLHAFASGNNVIIVFYATTKGKTGHVGIAFDQYKIVFHEIKKYNWTIVIPDTVATGELVYYDLWPDDDYFNAGRTAVDIPALYFKLPESATEEITLNSLYDRGIPHRENYPADGLLQIRTGWQQDHYLEQVLDSMITSNRPFNGKAFNCADFVKYPLEQLLRVNFDCREFVLTGWSSTPNKLYTALRRIAGVEVIKNADDVAQGNFIQERILYKLTHSK
jgi:hypothetical protein